MGAEAEQIFALFVEAGEGLREFAAARVGRGALEHGAMGVERFLPRARGAIGFAEFGLHRGAQLKLLHGRARRPVGGEDRGQWLAARGDPLAQFGVVALPAFDLQVEAGELGIKRAGWLRADGVLEAGAIWNGGAAGEGCGEQGERT